MCNKLTATCVNALFKLKDGALYYSEYLEPSRQPMGSPEGSSQSYCSHRPERDLKLLRQKVDLNSVMKRFLTR